MPMDDFDSIAMLSLDDMFVRMKCLTVQLNALLQESEVLAKTLPEYNADLGFALPNRFPVYDQFMSLFNKMYSYNRHARSYNNRMTQLLANTGVITFSGKVEVMAYYFVLLDFLNSFCYKRLDLISKYLKRVEKNVFKMIFGFLSMIKGNLTDTKNSLSLVLNKANLAGDANVPGEVMDIILQCKVRLCNDVKRIKNIIKARYFFPFARKCISSDDVKNLRALNLETQMILNLLAQKLIRNGCNLGNLFSNDSLSAGPSRPRQFSQKAHSNKIGPRDCKEALRQFLSREPAYEPD